MAAKPKPMSQIKQIFRFTQQGKSIKFIARSLSVSRNTVRKYLLLQQASGRAVEELLQLEDNQLQQVLLPPARWAMISDTRFCSSATTTSVVNFGEPALPVGCCGVSTGKTTPEATATVSFASTCTISVMLVI